MREDTVNEVLQFVEENDVKFVRLAFCDLFGTLKNISIMAEELPDAFAHGVSFDASAVDGFMNIEESDLLLFPDPGTVAAATGPGYSLLLRYTAPGWHTVYGGWPAHPARCHPQGCGHGLCLQGRGGMRVLSL